MNSPSWLAALVFVLALPAFGVEPPSSVFEAIRNNDLGKLASLPAADLEIRNRRGATPLMYAAAFGSPEALKLLLNKGANVNARNDFNASALLWCAGDPIKARMLVEHKADVNAQSTQGRTPLMIAARHDGNSEIVRLLLSKGANPSVSDKLGVTALHQAAHAGDAAIIKLLVEKGADVDAMDKKGDTPLMGATGLGSVAAVRLLLEKGARVNVARTSYAVVKHGPISLVGLTPLIHAAPYGSPELIRLLIRAGADVNARDSRQMTPIMFAVASETQNPEVVSLLIDAGADLSAKDKNGETALDWAAKFGNKQVMALLSKAGSQPGNQQIPSPKPNSASVRTPAHAVSKAVPLLQSSTTMFFRESGCVGCHHQPATSMVLKAVRNTGVNVDPGAAKEMAEALRLGWGVSEDDMLQGIHRGGGSDRIANQLLGIAAAGYASDSSIDAAATDLASLQHRDGFWFDEYEARAPIAEGLISRTAYAVRALQLWGWPGRKAEFEERIGRARKFLSNARTNTADDRAMLLLGRFWSGAPKQAIDEAARQVIAQQKPDGGWSGNENLSTDAWSTANSLIALIESGAATATDEVYRRGVQYLLSTQFEDGSWFVRSRAIKFQPYFQSGFPFDHDQWISTAATALAVRALTPAIPVQSEASAALKANQR